MRRTQVQFDILVVVGNNLIIVRLKSIDIIIGIEGDRDLDLRLDWDCLITLLIPLSIPLV